MNQKLPTSVYQRSAHSCRVILIAIGCIALCQSAYAVVPPPDGAYPNFNTAEGQNTLFSLSSGAANTAVGWYSLFSNTDGGFNTGVGAGTLLFNQSGNNNTALGTAALLFNTGSDNTATGVSALANNTTGNSNTAAGVNALAHNTTGISNNAFGWGALFSNNGDENTAVGVAALLSNTTGSFNTATGVNALSGNTTGVSNNAFGWGALLSNTTGNNNNAIGVRALQSNTSGSKNVAIGDTALSEDATGFFNTAIGDAALSQTAGTLNTAVGWRAGINNTGGSVNIYLGNEGGTPLENNVMRLGRTGDGPTLSTYIAGIFGTSVFGAAVYIDFEGQLGTVNSSRRFKHDIKAMDKASEAILSLKPVTFHYKSDPKNKPWFGLIAEDVAEVNPSLVVRDKDGELATVRYDQINAMLLNEFLKEHRKVQELEKGMATLTAQLKEQAAQIQKISTEVEMTKTAPAVALTDR